MAKSIHVVPKIDGGWSVRKDGAERASHTFRSKDEAIGRAREIARKGSTDLFVHRRDGTIRESTTYGHDPSAPKDKAK